MRPRVTATSAGGAQRLLRMALLAGTLLVPAREAVAAGSGPPPGGFEVAFRTGIVLPFGNVRTYAGDGPATVKLSDRFGMQVPLWLDIGYRFDRVFVGAYGQYAFGLPGGIACSSCSSSAIHLGLELQYHPFDWVTGQAPVGPWLGVGFGYEWATSSSTLHGWDFVRLGFGGDFAVASGLLLGPFVECSLSQFQKEDSSNIDGKELHFWLVFGLKLTWLP